MADDFSDARNEARLIWHASGAAHGASEGRGAGNDNHLILLRLAGPRARFCEHLQGKREGPPATVYLHRATNIHQCGTCATADDTRYIIDAYEPTTCDSCNQPAASYWPCTFVLSNIIVSCYTCDDCRDGRRRATEPEWFGDL